MIPALLRTYGKGKARRRLAIALLCLPFAIYGLLIAEAYRKPPLTLAGYTTAHDGAGRVVVGLDLQNRGRRPLRLLGADLVNLPGAKAEAWTSLGGGWMAGNMAALSTVNPERWDRPDKPYRDQEVSSLRMAVHCACKGEDRYGILFDLPPGTPPGTYQAVIRYRYLGWPFTVEDELEVEVPADRQPIE